MEETLEEIFAKKMHELPIYEIKMGDDPKTAMAFHIGKTLFIDGVGYKITTIMRHKADGETWYLVLGTPEKDPNDYRLLKAWKGRGVYLTYVQK